MELKKQRDTERIVEIVIVVMLGVTAIVMAWASWMSALHGGNQATNYTESNNIASEGNSEYNAAVQAQMQDMLLWNEISELQSELLFEQDAAVPDEDAISLINYKIYFKLNENLTDEMAQQIGWTFGESEDVDQVVTDWMQKEEALVTPFADEEFSQHYFTNALDLLEQSNAKLETGKLANQHGDEFGLVSVIYSVVLFLLGIASSLKSKNNRYIVVAFSLVCFLIATVYMLTLPMPDGFSITNFFS